MYGEWFYIPSRTYLFVDGNTHIYIIIKLNGKETFEDSIWGIETILTSCQEPISWGKIETGEGSNRQEIGPTSSTHY
jgi:hypothetical protein